MMTQPTYERLEQQAQRYDVAAENLYFQGYRRMAQLYRRLAAAMRRLSWMDWPAPKRRSHPDGTKPNTRHSRAESGSQPSG